MVPAVTVNTGVLLINIFVFFSLMNCHNGDGISHKSPYYQYLPPNCTVGSFKEIKKVTDAKVNISLRKYQSPQLYLPYRVSFVLW